MLRDLCRVMSRNYTILVIDERGELFPQGFAKGRRLDVLTQCPKKEAIEMGIRTMGPQILAVDEITAEEDCNLLLYAANCGVRLLATAHASSLEDLQKRPAYHRLLEKEVFTHILCLQQDRSVLLNRGYL